MYSLLMTLFSQQYGFKVTIQKFYVPKPYLSQGLSKISADSLSVKKLTLKMILNEDLLPSKLLRACFDLWALTSTNRLTLIKFPGVIPSGWTLRNSTLLIFKILSFFLKQQNRFFKDNLHGSPVHKRQMLSFSGFGVGNKSTQKEGL